MMEWKRQKKVREIHQKYTKELTHKHLFVLKSKTKLSHDNDDKDKKAFEGLIAKAYEALNKIRWVQVILMYVAGSSDLQLFFDFNRTSVGVLDLTKNKFIYGTTSTKFSKIFIGAKNLLDEQKCVEVYGTLAHEFCHFATNMLYKNDCKPYRAIEGIKEFDFNKVVQFCIKRKNSEEIIWRVFDAPKNLWHAELIARGKFVSKVSLRN